MNWEWKGEGGKLPLRERKTFEENERGSRHFWNCIPPLLKKVFFFASFSQKRKKERKSTRESEIDSSRHQKLQPQIGKTRNTCNTKRNFFFPRKTAKMFFAFYFQGRRRRLLQLPTFLLLSRDAFQVVWESFLLFGRMIFAPLPSDIKVMPCQPFFSGCSEARPRNSEWHVWGRRKKLAEWVSFIFALIRGKKKIVEARFRCSISVTLRFAKGYDIAQSTCFMGDLPLQC